MNTRIQHLLDDLRYRLKSPVYRLLRKSILFDSAYYLETNLDVALSGTLPLIHYITSGFSELRQPCPLFDADYYEKQLEWLEKQPQNPIVHYLTEGWEMGLKPNPLFDTKYYIRQYKDVDFTKVNPLVHFLENDDTTCQTCSPHHYFDPEFYRFHNSDAVSHTDSPIKHYLTIGCREMRRPSIWFDTTWYKNKYNVSNNPIAHYFISGIKEKKSPSPLFDPTFYAKTYNVQDDNDLFAHYINEGMERDHKPCAWFDPSFYRQTYLFGQKDALPPLKHFLQQGLQEKLSPNREIHELSEKPLISLLVPVYNVTPGQLINCILSVVYQSYPHWELCLVDDCSTKDTVRPLLKKWAAQDRRIKIHFMKHNGGISSATNSAASLASGSYYGLLDNDDELSPEALFSFVQRINSDGSDLLYCDEDLIGADGRQFSIFRKPEFNNELLLCHNYITHCLFTKRSLFEAVGGCDSALDGAQDLDLFLKLSEKADKISHIPQILYHWRASESSTSINHSQKEYADKAGRQAIANALVRRKIAAEVDNTDLKFYYRARRTIKENISVTLVVHWHHSNQNRDIFSWLTGLLDRSGHTPVQIVVVSESSAVCELLQDLTIKTECPIICRTVAKEMSTPAAYNVALNYVAGDLVAFLSRDFNCQTDGWLSALIEYGQQDGTGMVGGRIERKGNHIPTPTPIPDFTVSSPLYFAQYITSCSVLMNGLHCPQEVQSVDGELCLIQTNLLKTLNGFNDEEYPLLFWIHDLCYRLLEHGKTNMYTPYSTAILTDKAHNQSLADHEHGLQQEMSRFQQNWSSLLNKKDPFFNQEIVADQGIPTEQLHSWLTTNTFQT